MVLYKTVQLLKLTSLAWPDILVPNQAVLDIGAGQVWVTCYLRNRILYHIIFLVLFGCRIS